MNVGNSLLERARYQCPLVTKFYFCQLTVINGSCVSFGCKWSKEWGMTRNNCAIITNVQKFVLIIVFSKSAKYLFDISIKVVPHYRDKHFCVYLHHMKRIC